MKLPTGKTIFEDKTSLLPEVVARTVLDEMQQKGHVLPSKEQQDWFIKHADVWTRYLHANNSMWKRKLESESGRGRLYLFVGHWAEAFLMDPVGYFEKHPLEELETA